MKRKPGGGPDSSSTTLSVTVGDKREGCEPDVGTAAYKRFAEAKEKALKSVCP